MPRFYIPEPVIQHAAWKVLGLSCGGTLPDDDTVQRCPAVQDAQIVPYFLHVRVRKPGE